MHLPLLPSLSSFIFIYSSFFFFPLYKSLYTITLSSFIYSSLSPFVHLQLHVQLFFFFIMDSSSFSLFSFMTLFMLFSSNRSEGVPLSTNSRWIVDNRSGQRVKLACVNWASHLKPVVTEGLSKKPLDQISKRILAMGFNCVRLTWPIYLATNDTLASLTVKQSFQNFGLNEDIVGIRINNPSIIDLSLIKAFQVRLNTNY